MIYLSNDHKLTSIIHFHPKLCKLISFPIDIRKPGPKLNPIWMLQYGYNFTVYTTRATIARDEFTLILILTSSTSTI